MNGPKEGKERAKSDCPAMIAGLAATKKKLKKNTFFLNEKQIQTNKIFNYKKVNPRAFDESIARKNSDLVQIW